MNADSGYRVRRASPGDLDLVLRHRRRMFEDMGYRDVATLDVMQAAAEPFMAQGLADGSYRGFLVEDERGDVVAGGGVALVPFQPHPRDPTSRRAFILNMFTEPAHRRRGLARRLMQAMVTWCREQGFQAVSLHASDEGRPLYEALGFTPTNEMRLLLR